MPNGTAGQATPIERFELAIADADKLAELFGELLKEKGIHHEVLKRSGFIMAMTAWETYLESRLVLAFERKIGAHADTFSAQKLRQRLDADIAALHNPTSQKVQKLFADYLGIAILEKWCWGSGKAETTRELLDSNIKTRGNIVHEHQPLIGEDGKPTKHPVSIDELRGTIKFLRNLVLANEKALEEAGL